jgi:hypothetical protein
MSSMPATLDRIRRHLVGLRMPRSLEVLEHLLRQLERGEISALEAIDNLLDEELSLREGRRELCGNLGDGLIRRRSALACR